MYQYFFFFVFSLELTGVICTSMCEDFATCSTCILSVLDNCQWCSDENHKEKRCLSAKLVNKTSCEFLISKPDIKLDITKNDDWSGGEDEKKIVQLRPQNVVIKSASPGASVDIKMHYKPAKDAPLDIYFLMDNSGNIAKYKTMLTNYATSIFEEIKNYTNNVRLGIGTFVEKPVLPYANPDEHNVYTFNNHLPLTNDTEQFKSTLKDIKHGSNYDTPEDIFDGLMQAMLCVDQVNWRKDSRRIIVVITNAFYHTAGDGKMVGALKRYNIECNRNENMDAVMDYPSIGQISKVAKDNGFVTIFTYVDDSNNNLVKNYFMLLSQKINGAKYAKLGSTNIAKIIKKEYIKIIEDVNIRYESSSDIQVTIKKKCQKCTAMHFNPLEFLVTVKVLSCPNPPKEKEVIKIIPVSLNEELHVEIEFNCQCECEKKKSTDMNSKKCSGNGEYQCGICKCNPDRSGDDCACEIDSVSLISNYDNCKKNPNDTSLCSGRGECSCGKCKPCHEGFFGAFCEYDQNACPRPGGKLCSGHGECKMGICQCDLDWAHSLSGIKDCGCTLKQISCIAPHSDKVCSGNGECHCGKCTCTNTVNSNDTCTGRYCDKCSWFAAKRCEELQDYAYCRFLNKTSCQQMYNETDTIVVFANRSEINSPNNTEWYMANWCRFNVEDDESIFVFKYYYSSAETDTETGTDETTLILVIQKELDEKPPADIWVTVGSAVGGVLLIGLLSLLLWKVLTDLYDAKEYNQFVEKARAAGYNVNMTENPWYEPPSTTFINPTHNPSALK